MALSALSAALSAALQLAAGAGGADSRGEVPAATAAPAAAASSSASTGFVGLLRRGPRAVRLIILARYLSDTSSAITLGPLFDAYLLMRGGSNEFVGKVESARGIASLAAAVPIGWAGDHFPRHRVLQVILGLGVVAVALLLVGIPTDSTWMIGVGVVIMAMHNQGTFTLLPVAMADATTPGEQRTVGISGMATVTSAGAACGLALQLLMILVFGRNEWSVQELHWVLPFGFVFFALFCPVLLRLTSPGVFPFAAIASAPGAGTGGGGAGDASASLGADGGRGGGAREKRIALASADSLRLDSAVAGTGAGAGGAGGASSRDGGSSCDAEAQSGAAADRGEQPAEAQEPPTPAFDWLIAGLCEFASFVTSLGSGATFKYWPLFFKKDYGFSPTAVCAMQLGIYSSVAVLSTITPKIARRFGRLPVYNAVHVTATCLLFLIALQPLRLEVMVPIVILRNGIINAGTPLVMATVLELVPSKHRGKWSSIAALRRMSWSGSAFIGGVLSDSHDYRYAFLITACIHSVAGGLLLFVNVLMAWRTVMERRRARQCTAEG